MTEHDVRPQLERDQRCANVAEAFVHLVVEQGVEHLFLNPGTDTAPLQEAIVAMGGRGERAPRVQLCPDERVAMAAAQSVWQRTGRPQLVVVHVDVGTLALGAAIHNAQRTNSGVVVLAGTAPRTFDDELPGGRSIPVHWQQDQIDQLGILRGFTKWTQEITMFETMPTLVPRAFQIAASGPAGPVYLTVARELLMRRTESVRVVPARRRPVALPPAAPAEAIARAAEWLATAERPVLVTSRLGRQPRAVGTLAELASRVGVAVVDSREYLNLASDHPCYVEDDGAVTEVLGAADLVLLVDVEVPWVPMHRRPPEEARVVQIDLDPVKPSIGNWSYPVDLSIQADPADALAQLVAAVDERSTDADRARWATRLDELQQSKAQRQRRRDEAVRRSAAETPVSAIALVNVLSRLLDDDTVVYEEVTTNDSLVREHLHRSQPGTIYAIGAAGLGWAPGAALGAKLVEPDREVVALVGDGTFIFSAPLAWLWAARDAGAPFMTVVLNNAGYRAAKLPVAQLFPDGASVTRADFTGTVMTDPPDFAAVAAACGAHGEHLEDPDQLEAAITRAREAVRDGRCAVVDVRLADI